MATTAAMKNSKTPKLRLQPGNANHPHTADIAEAEPIAINPTERIIRYSHASEGPSVGDSPSLPLGRY